MEHINLLNALLRKDLSSFIQKAFHTVSPADVYRHNWHIDLVAWHLERCLAGHTKRLIITLPPRNLKSICASVAFPAWVLGKDPSKRLICASYSNELTAKHSRDCRAVMTSDWYRRIFPKTRLDPFKNTELEFATTRCGGRLGTSIGGTLTGRGGNIILIDDPLKPSEAMSKTKREAVKQWYDGTLYSRLDDKARDVIIIVMQRIHLDDLVGHVLGKEDWVHVNLPATAETPERFELGPDHVFERQIGEVLHEGREPESVLKQIKSTLGSFAYNAQYQQNPVSPSGNLVKWKWFKSYGQVPPKEPGDEIIQSWDTASKAEEIHDYSVCTTWLKKNNLYYLIDVTRDRWNYPQLKARIVREYQRHKADTVIIEDKGSGTQLIQDLAHEGILHPNSFTPQSDKETRMSTQSAKIEAGQVLLPEHAPWFDDFKTEIMAFPNGRHDDQVDSLSQFLIWITDRERRPKFQWYVGD